MQRAKAFKAADVHNFEQLDVLEDEETKGKSLIHHPEHIVLFAVQEEKFGEKKFEKRFRILENLKSSLPAISTAKKKAEIEGNDERNLPRFEIWYLFTHNCSVMALSSSSRPFSTCLLRSFASVFTPFRVAQLQHSSVSFFLLVSALLSFCSSSCCIACQFPHRSFVVPSSFHTSTSNVCGIFFFIFTFSFCLFVVQISIRSFLTGSHSQKHADEQKLSEHIIKAAAAAESDAEVKAMNSDEKKAQTETSKQGEEKKATDKQEEATTKAACLQEQIASLEKQVSALQSSVTVTRDKLLRALADVDNVRRRGEQEVMTAKKYGVAGTGEEQRERGLEERADRICIL